MTQQTEIAILAGGCFWCIEAAFNTIDGVKGAMSGYMGGQTEKPTYDTVCSGSTGHAEVVKIPFDPSKISYREILEIFFAIHNPTQLNRQGNDVGSQYRSEIFYTSEQQKQQALDIIDEMNNDQVWTGIVTKVSAEKTFYVAEDTHQDYFNKHPENRYCQAIVSPKLAKFKQTFADKLKIAA